jgi:phage gp36-like protein
MLIDLTDRSQPATGSIDTDVVDRALADTDSMIDGYLAVRYQLPLSSVPSLVTDLAQAIAIYKMHRRTAADKIREDYLDAIKTLDKISKGSIRLDIAGVEPASSGSGGVQASETDRPLTNDSLKGLI